MTAWGTGDLGSCYHAAKAGQSKPQSDEDPYTMLTDEDSRFGVGQEGASVPQLYVLIDNPQTGQSLKRWAQGELVEEELESSTLGVWDGLAKTVGEGGEPCWVETPAGGGWAARSAGGEEGATLCVCVTERPAQDDPPPAHLRDQFDLLGQAARQSARLQATTSLLEQTRQACRELEEGQAHLLHTERLRALGELASGLAHDFNNLLATISLRAEMGMRAATDERLRGYFHGIHASAMRGANIVRRVQEFTGARGSAEQELLDLGEVVRDALETAWQQWRDKADSRDAPIALRMQVEDDLHIMAGLDDIREVVGSLVLNALEAMPEGGDIWVAVSRRGEEGLLSVRDAGQGMPPEVAKRAFDPFFSTKDRDHVGLGLSVAYGIVSRGGGEVSLTSQAGAGTTVEVALPLARHRPRSPDGPGSPARERPPPAPLARHQLPGG